MQLFVTEFRLGYMKQLVFLLLSILLGDSFFGQDWAPVGSKWIYSRAVIDYSNVEVYESILDTLIENKVCRKIVSYRVDDGLIEPIESVNYLYYENNRVYFYKWGQFNLVFDFSVQLGQDFTAVGPDDQLNIGGFELVHIESYLINGNNFNHFFYQSEDNLFFADGVLDQVGGYIRFFPDAQGAYPPEHDYLQCYITGDTIYYPRNDSEYCNYFRTLKIKELEQNGLYFSPNPLSELSTLEIPAELGAIRDISVYGLNGQESSAYEWKERKISLRASDFVPGVYFIRVETEKQRLFGKFAAE